MVSQENRLLETNWLFWGMAEMFGILVLSCVSHTYNACYRCSMQKKKNKHWIMNHVWWFCSLSQHADEYGELIFKQQSGINWCNRFLHQDQWQDLTSFSLMLILLTERLDFWNLISIMKFWFYWKKTARLIKNLLFNNLWLWNRLILTSLMISGCCWILSKSFDLLHCLHHICRHVILLLIGAVVFVNINAIAKENCINSHLKNSHEAVNDEICDD